MTTKHKPGAILPHDLMDSAEVAEAFGVSMTSIRIALTQPDTFPSLAARLPKPLRKIGRGHVWARADVEAALEAKP